MKILFTKDEIDNRIKDVSFELNKLYRNESVCLIYLLEGSKYFVNKLTPYLNFSYNLQPVKISTYEGTKSAYSPNLVTDITCNLKMKNILLVDDILDTGRTLKYMIDLILLNDIKSIRTLVSIDKLERREVDINPDYSLFQIDRGFVIGFGMDYNGKFRDLEDIFILDEEEVP